MACDVALGRGHAEAVIQPTALFDPRGGLMAGLCPASAALHSVAVGTNLGRGTMPSRRERGPAGGFSVPASEVVAGSIAEGRSGFGSAEEEALREITAQGLQFVELGLRLESFGDRGHSERVGQTDDRGNDAGVFGLVAETVDEGLVDLERFDGKAFEVRE